MLSKLIFCCSLILFALGFMLPIEWLAMMQRSNGDLFIPVSSGSEDPMIIKIALMSYLVSSIYSGFFVVLAREGRSLILVYTLNSIFYLICMFLVSLDTSIVMAARLGNWVPTLQAGLWLACTIAITWVAFNQSFKRDAASGAH